jgi:3-dehydroquinate dehydratase
VAFVTIKGQGPQGYLLALDVVAQRLASPADA